jgi:hypothetical protein
MFETIVKEESSISGSDKYWLRGALLEERNRACAPITCPRHSQRIRDSEPTLLCRVAGGSHSLRALTPSGHFKPDLDLELPP